MGAYLNVCSYKRDNAYIISEIRSSGMVEVDFDKIQSFSNQDQISFRNGISIIQQLINDKYRADAGFHTLGEFHFYILAISPEENISYLRNGDQVTVTMFEAARILDVVKRINSFAKPGNDVTQQEVDNLKKLEEMASKAAASNDIIQFMWG